MDESLNGSPNIYVPFYLSATVHRPIPSSLCNVYKYVPKAEVFMSISILVLPSCRVLCGEDFGALWCSLTRFWCVVMLPDQRRV